MKIDEAIERLSEALRLTPIWQGGKFGDALKLGIEALKRIKETRTDYGVVLEMPLPGETTD